MAANGEFVNDLRSRWLASFGVIPLLHSLPLQGIAISLYPPNRRWSPLQPSTNALWWETT
jgi:hypothetical protein